jgi:hypothetical protein
MTGKQFHKWVADPTLLDRHTIADLQVLVRRYPYFQTAQLLLAKNLKSEQHIDQRRQLHIAAIYATDRRLLFRLLDESHPMAKSTEESIIDADMPEVIPERADVQRPEMVDVEPPLETEQSQMAKLDQIEASDQAVGHIIAVTGPDAIVPIGTDQQERAEEEVTQMETESRSDALSLYDLIPEPLIYRIEDAELPELPVHQDTPDSLTFEQWLVWVQQSGLSVPPLSPSTSRISKSSDNMSLIEDFLASQSTKERSQRAEFFKPSKAAEDSNRQEFSVISETLANIYEQQGKFALAVKAFDALASKYPEKSSYFAARKMAALEKQGGLSN